LPFARPDAVFLDADLRIAKREVLGAATPVRSGGASVEEARLGQEKGPRADRAEAAHAAGHPAQPVEDRTVVEEGVHTAAAHDEQRVDIAAQSAEVTSGRNRKPDEATSGPASVTDHRDRVPGWVRPSSRRQPGRPGEHLQRTGEVERLDVGICEERDAQGPGGDGAVSCPPSCADDALSARH